MNRVVMELDVKRKLWRSSYFTAKARRVIEAYVKRSQELPRDFLRAAATIPRNAISRGPVLAIRDRIIPGTRKTVSVRTLN